VPAERSGMPTSLIRGRQVVCRIAGPDQAIVLDDGAVVQQDGLIVAVGPYAELAASYQVDEVFGSAGHVVLPGLVDAHHHVGITPFQLGAPDLPLELWGAARSGTRDVDLYLDTLYSAFELLESGVTTVHHLHWARRGPWREWPSLGEQVLRAYRDIGLRVCYSPMFRDQNQIVYEPDSSFVQRLPASIGDEIGATPEARAIPLDWFTDELFGGLWERYGRNQADRVRIQLTPHNLQWCSDAAFESIADCARRHGVGMHVHLLETPYQREYARRGRGGSAVRHLAELGFLGPDVTLGHAVWVDEDELDLLAERGTMLCHNPSSNLRLQNGIAPLNAWLERGLTVGLGLDEAGLNDDRDLLQEMRLALKLHRPPGHAQPAPTANQVFRMATEHGAQTTHYRDEIGVIEPGRRADLTLLRWEQLAYPYLDPSVSVVDAVVQRAKTSAVDTVMVGGEVVLRDGRSTRLSKQEVLAELAASLNVPLRPDEERRREAARELFPHVKAFYAGWLADQPGEPFYRYNRRRP
jgi:5-methylthioadenosine/S-adenosylhomocysteine deaminase